MRCRYALWVVLLAAVLSLPVQAKDGGDTQDVGGIIYTTATHNDPTGTGYDAVVGAQVVVKGTKLKTTTDGRGMFLFKNVPVGQITVVATKKGFGAATRQVAVQMQPMPVMVRIVMNPPGYSNVAHTTVGPGTVYVAFAARQADRTKLAGTGSDMGMASGNLQTFRAAIIAGANPLSVAANSPGPMRGWNGRNKGNPVTYHGNTLMVLPPDSPANAGFLNMSSAPYWLCFNRAGTILYVSDASRQIQVYDAVHGDQLLRSLPVQGIVADLRLSPNGRYLLAPVMAARPGVMVIDTTSQDPVAFVPINVQGAAQPRAALMNRQGTRLYVVTGTPQDGQLTMVNANTGQTLGTVPVGANPTGAAMSTDGRYVYVVNSGSGSVTVVDAWSGAAVGTIHVGVSPQRVAVSPDGSRVFVTNKGSNTVTVLDGRTNATLATVPVGDGPLDVAVSPDSKTAFVTCKNAGTVVSLNAMTGAVENTTDPMPESSPFGLAVRP